MKFYSERAVLIGTFFGGPLVAGILVRRNFLNVGNEEHGRLSLLISIAATVIIFGGITLIPESIADRIPNVVIPTIYSAIIYQIVKHVQGDTLKAHKENNGEFYSVWRAVGIGTLCLVAIFMILFVYFMLMGEMV